MIQRNVDAQGKATAMGERQLLTHSRLASYKTCPRKHYLQYELGIRPDRESTPLRIGSAYHLGHEVLNKTGSLDLACHVIRDGYADIPAWVDDVNAWWCECETVLRLLCAYVWMWESDSLEIITTELSFDMMIRSPDGGVTPNFRLAGKIDNIVRLTDGRLAVREIKTTGDSIGPDSDYWRRLNRDHQISLYVVAARELGYEVETVLYDATHKPGMQPYKATPTEKRRYKKNGEPYADVREYDESSTDWGARFTQDIMNRPDFYFARKEIARPDNELDLFRAELWQQQKQIREAQKSRYWFRNTASCQHPYKCPYHDAICDMKDIENETLPEGWQYVENIHPELEKTNGIGTGTTENATQSTTAG